MFKVLKIYLRTPLSSNKGNLQSIPRCFSTKPQTVKEEVQQESSDPPDDNVIRGQQHKLSNFDKRIMVFGGKFKKLDDVPNSVSAASFDSARNKARIKLSNYMMILTAIACVGVAISGRRAAERGESVHQMNLDWHKEMNKK